MQVSPFFKILNKKIEKYDKLAANPFTIPQSVTIIWVDNPSEEQENFNSENTD